MNSINTYVFHKSQIDTHWSTAAIKPSYAFGFMRPGICFIYDMGSLFTQISLVYIRVKYKSTKTGRVRVKPLTVTRIYYYIRKHNFVLYTSSVVRRRQSVMQVFGFRLCCHYCGRCHRHHRCRKNLGKTKASCVGKLLTLSLVFFSYVNYYVF